VPSYGCGGCAGPLGFLPSAARASGLSRNPTLQPCRAEDVHNRARSRLAKKLDRANFASACGEEQARARAHTCDSGNRAKRYAAQVGIGGAFVLAFDPIKIGACRKLGE